MTDKQMMICGAAEDCTSRGSFESCKPHEKTDACVGPCSLHSKPSRCVPYQPTPEYVRVTGCKFHQFWYSNKTGESFKVTKEHGNTYFVEHRGGVTTIFKADCEPCVAPDNHELHVRLHQKMEKELKDRPSEVVCVKAKDNACSARHCDHYWAHTHPAGIPATAPLCSMVLDCVPVGKAFGPCEALKETTTQDDYEDLRQRIIRYGRFDPETPDRLFALLRQISVPHEITLDMARYIDGERKMVPIKKETPMKYKQLKPISLELLWDAQLDKNDPEFLKEWAVFMNWSSLCGSMWSRPWIAASMYSEFIKDMKTNDHGPAWLSFMERHGFIEKELAEEVRPCATCRFTKAKYCKMLCSEPECIGWLPPAVESHREGCICKICCPSEAFEPFNLTINVSTPEQAIEIYKCLFPTDHAKFLLSEKLKAHGIEP